MCGPNFLFCFSIVKYFLICQKHRSWILSINYFEVENILAVHDNVRFPVKMLCEL